jgi:hypothetical protein
MKPPATDPNIRHEIPVSLGKPSLRRRLEAYYSLIAPDQIADTAEWLTKFDQIWSKFGGTDAGEQTLATKLAKKYGPTVRLLLAASSGQQKKSPSSTAVSSAIRDEAWYQLTDKERSSGTQSPHWLELQRRLLPPIRVRARTTLRSTSVHGWIGSINAGLCFPRQTHCTEPPPASGIDRKNNQKLELVPPRRTTRRHANDRGHLLALAHSQSRTKTPRVLSACYAAFSRIVSGYASLCDTSMGSGGLSRVI